MNLPSENKETLKLIADTLSKVLESELALNEKLNAVFQLYQLLLEKMTDDAPIGFTSLFTRVVYISNRLNIPRKDVILHHHFRRSFMSKERELASDHLILGQYLIVKLLKFVEPAIELPDLDRPVFELPLSPSAIQFQRCIEGMVIQASQASQHIQFIREDEGQEVLDVKFSDEKFIKQASIIFKHLPLPLRVNLIDCERENDGYWTAKAFVVKPDFLVSVTSIAECFQADGAFSTNYLVKKLIPTEPSVHMLIGNVVNHLLDEIIHQPDLRFKDVAKTLFSISPEQFSLMSDPDLKMCLDKVKMHFDNLKRVINKDLDKIGVGKENTYLEPSFYAPQYGIYGRLDLYHFDEADNQSNIIELKSGKLFRPNTYGLNENHYIQTLLYDLMIETVIRQQTKSNNYILYSALSADGLKYAPKVRQKQYDALFVRNDIMMIEEILSRVDEEKYGYILDKINPEQIPVGFNFTKRDAQRFYDAYSKLEGYEKDYLKSYISFISKEYHLAKVGEHGLFKTNGMASLWLNSFEDKVDQFSILTNMEIVTNNSSLPIPTVSLKYTSSSNLISKFRIGDIVVLYPSVNSSAQVLKHQIFKSTILDLTNKGIKLRLRARQKNTEVFEKYNLWNIEPDTLDSGFNQQFGGLFEFINSSASYREIWMGIRPPSKPKVTNVVPHYSKMTTEQSQILQAAVDANQYYLLWGPPGTGKTSVMIHHLVKYYVEETNNTILLLAYTNRAVDEICKAIGAITDDSYIRIGSRYSAGKKFRPKLLSVISEQLSSRRELLTKIQNTRVFVSTVSSFQGKKELLKFKNFDISVIDEASQLLEPMLLGLLKYFKKSILIGDHKQLPAVVAQDESKRKIKSEVLIEKTGISDCGISLFERLYKQCLDNDWVWAVGALSYQGRMHEQIQHFVSENFYGGSLKSLDKIKRLKRDYVETFPEGIHGVLMKHRMIFINIPIEDSFASKTNTQEAQVVRRLIALWEENYKTFDFNFDKSSVGVISPFRAQIAHIKSELPDRFSDLITIDTIERYQGGARNQIILSLAVNRVELLDSITNINAEGIDRKLNVALTRAKEHIIILGNRYILSKNPMYNTLINQCFTLELEDFI